MRAVDLKPVAVVATLLLPAALFYARALADGLLTLVAVLFLLHCATTGRWTWLRQPWVWLAAAFWLLQLVASAAADTRAVGQALALLRLFVFAAALQGWVLEGARARRGLAVVIALAALWVVAESWQQYLLGTNVLGVPRFGDGALTGPFVGPRAGNTLLMVVFTGLMPMVIRCVLAGGTAAALAGSALLALLLATMILIGQRMPTLLMVLGLVLMGLLFRRLRRPLLLAAAVGALLLLALPVLSPPTFAKLVVHFTDQMLSFWASPYGQLYIRATVMTMAHPWLGLGFDGFRDFCTEPGYAHGIAALGLPAPPAGSPDSCNLHPHNYYFQAATMAGVPGLVLFTGLVLAWIVPLLRALRPERDAGQAMLFVTFCVMLWPFASTSSLFTLPTAGWVFLNTGWALAASRPREPSQG